MIKQKVMKIRVELQNRELKKTGNNSYKNYSYFELKDFLPTINQMQLDMNIFSQVTFKDGECKLTLEDLDDSSVIEFTSPVGDCGQTNKIQDIGCQHTYMRRYMYMLAYEICEADKVDSTENSIEKTEPTGEAKTETCPSSVNQRKYLWGLAKSKGVSEEEVRAMLKEVGKESTKDLTFNEASKLIQKLQKKTA